MNNIILLGDSCSVSWLLDSCNIKRETGLFEWCRSEFFKDIIYTINNINDVNVDYYKLPGNVCIRGTDIHTSHYSLQQFDEKIKRRIQRFIDIVKSNVEIVFIRRNEYCNSNLTIKEINEFEKAIKNINPYCKYKLLLLTTTEELINYPNITHKILKINTMENPKESQKNEEDIALWKGIFNELGIQVNV